MIIELSKDQSFYGLLSKAELDNETSSLVKQDASPLEIKMSLLKNIDSSNMVKYRKYIKKADEEDAKRRKDEMRSQEEDYVAPTTDIVEEQLEGEASDARGVMASDLLEKDKENKAYNALNTLETLLLPLQKIAQDARVVKQGSNKYQVFGVDRPYIKIGKTPKSSNRVINIFKILELQPNYFMKQYGSLLVNGILSGKQFSKDKETGDVTYQTNDKDIDVKKLAAEYTKLTEIKIDVLDESRTSTSSKVTLSRVLALLHMEKHGYMPKSSVTGKDKRKRGRELRGVMARLNRGQDEGGDREINREFRKATQLTTRYRKYVQKIKMRAQAVQTTIDDLEEVLADTDALVARKFRELNNALQVVLSRGGYKKTSPEEIRAKTSELRELQNNKEKYVKEAKDEIEKEIADEKVKLGKYSSDLKAAIQSENLTKDFMKKVDMFSGMNPIAEIKNIMIEGLNACSRMNQIMKKIEKQSAKAEQDISRGSMVYLSENPDARWESVGGDMEFIGLPTIANEAIRRIDSLLDELDEQSQKLQDVNQRLSELIEGKKPETFSEESE
jgi:hypothetical protein